MQNFARGEAASFQHLGLLHFFFAFFAMAAAVKLKTSTNYLNMNGNGAMYMQRSSWGRLSTSHNGTAAAQDKPLLGRSRGTVERVSETQGAAYVALWNGSLRHLMQTLQTSKQPNPN